MRAVLRRSIGLPAAAAMVVGTIVGASIFVQPSEVSRAVPGFAGMLLVWVVAGALTLVRRERLRRARVGVSPHGRRLCLPARDVLAGGRVPLGLGDVLEHALRHHRGDRGRLRALRRRASSRSATPASASSPSGASWCSRRSTMSGVRQGSAVQTGLTVVKVAAIGVLLVVLFGSRAPRAAGARRRRGRDDPRVLRGARRRPVRLRRLAHGHVCRRGDARPRAHDSARPDAGHGRRRRPVPGAERRLSARAAARSRARVDARRGRCDAKPPRAGALGGDLAPRHRLGLRRDERDHPRRSARVLRDGGRRPRVPVDVGGAPALQDAARRDSRAGGVGVGAGR